MIKFILMSMIFFCAKILADCSPPPIHEFVMKVHQCQAAQFSIDLSEDYDWYNFEENEKYKSGVLLSGLVTENKYELDENLESKMAWQENSYKTVFIDGDALKFCKKFKSANIKLSEMAVCCDTLPALGYCTVPFPIASPVQK